MSSIVSEKIDFPKLANITLGVGVIVVALFGFFGHDQSDTGTLVLQIVGLLLALCLGIGVEWFAFFG